MKTQVDRTEDDQQRKRRKGGGPGVEDALVLAFDCENPASPPAFLRLEGVDAVDIGRGVARAQVRGTRKPVRISLSIVDKWASSPVHATLERMLDGWVIADNRSRNGTFVNGRSITRTQLFDEDLIEIGHTFFIFREGLEAGAPQPAPPSLAPRFATLLPSLAATFERAGLLARSQVPLLIHGETGTGKEILAEALHDLSGRGPWVTVNCAAINASLLESELFGHRRGAFTGAQDDRVGLVQSADKGTLFLDEIGDLPAPAQAALLRVLQQKEVQPVGTNHPIKVDVRFVSATHRDLKATGSFREDLFGRIAGAVVELPALRDRREDLGLLVGAIIQAHDDIDPGKISFSCDAGRALFTHDWPRNIRELEKAIHSSAVLAHGKRIELEHLPEEVHEAPAGDLDDGEAQRRAQLVDLLTEHRGNVAAVSRAMGKARMQVHRWVQRYKIDLDTFRR